VLNQEKGKMEIEYSTEIEDLQRLQRRYPIESEEAIVDALKIIVTRMEGAVKKRTPVGVGGAAGLRGSIFGEITRRNQEVVGKVGSPLEYAEVIEYGRKPNNRMPPKEPIMLWLRRKLRMDWDEAEEVQFGIRVNIARWGFLTWPEGARMFEKSFQEHERWIYRMLKGIPGRIAKKINNV
jgi:hypothetical protein